MKLIVIGSGDAAHLRLNSPYVSNYHAELLLLDNGDILLTDKGSKNGTFLNDQRLAPDKEISIKRGDNVRFADKVLDWQYIPSVNIDLTKIKEMRGVGTNFRNKYQLQGEKVSRYHATLIRKSDNKWYIQDHSKNGTTVNGQKISSNMDVKLKKGDKILCAGVVVPNPYGEGSSFNYRLMIPLILGILLLSGAGIYLITQKSKAKNSQEELAMVNEDKSPVLDKSLTDEQIYTKYKNSIVFLIGYYHYKVSAGNFDLDLLDLPKEVAYVLQRDKSTGKIGKKLVPVTSKNKADLGFYMGTGFFVSADGKIMTNLHITRPWLFEDEMSIISDKYKMFLASKAAELPLLNAYTSQVKVEGVLDFIGMIPNESYFSEDNLKHCRELVGHDNKEKDVAILQVDTKKLPEGCTLVDLNQAVVNDEEISVGSHMFTMGFPHGLDLQNPETSKGIQLFAQGGSINQGCSEYYFGFNAPAFQGASGSPLFNAKGQLIGILSKGVTFSQGFNFAVKAVYGKELYQQSLSK